MSSLVLTLIGEDRPGVVGRLAEVVAQHHGNWLESRMAHLGGQFAGILRVEVEEQHAAALLAALKALAAEELKLVVEQTDTSPREEGYLIATLEIVGNDRPGIVAEISRELARERVNVEDFVTECGSAPMSGGSIFRASGRLRLPGDLPLERLRENLERIGHDLLVEISLAVAEER